MATKNNRIAITITKDMKEDLEQIAKQKNISVSKAATDMIAFALDVQEDIYLEEWAQDRTKTFKIEEALTHEEVWKDILK